MIAFGPVPSRRLGYSLGINHIPPKHCSYSCVYCQVGRTSHLQITRREYFPIYQIIQAVEHKMVESARAGRTIDYLTFVPDGEPTLDINLGKNIEGLKKFGKPIAVISNGSLIDHTEVQDDLLQADWVSLKVDAVNEADWRRINRPHGTLSLPAILDGILAFRNRFQGQLVTETMLVSGLNDSETAIQNLSTFLQRLAPYKSYLSLPTRPPAESWVKPPDAEALQRVLSFLTANIDFLDLLFETEVGDFIATGDIYEDILSITAVHPIREEALRLMVDHAGESWLVVEELLAQKRLTSIKYREEWFYMRPYSNPMPD